MDDNQYEQRKTGATVAAILIIVLVSSMVWDEFDPGSNRCDEPPCTLGQLIPLMKQDRGLLDHGH